MPDMQIVVRDGDMALLNEIAEREWRTVQQQASAMVEAVLSTARARANAPARQRAAPRRTAARGNGVVRVEA